MQTNTTTGTRPARRRLVGRSALPTAALLVTALLSTAGCASTIVGGSDTTAVSPTTAATAATPSTAAAGGSTASTAASGGSSSTAAASGTASGSVTNLPAGWKVVTGTGASIGVPQQWVDLKPLVTDPAKRAEFEKSIQDQSTSAYIDSLAPQLIDQINIIAMDATTSASGFTTTVNVIVDDSGLITDLDTIESIVPSQLGTVGGDVNSTNRALVGGLETLVVDYTLTTAAGVKATGRQYHQINGSSVVTTTFTAVPAKVDVALWDQMVGTVTLGAGA